MKKITLPALEPIQASLPEFAPDQSTMARFDADPMELWRACNTWMERVLHPEGLSDPDCGFDQLTQALRLWASTHGLGDAMVLADAATAAYRREAIGDAVLRAQAFVDLIKSRAELRTPAPAPTEQPTVAVPTERGRTRGGLTVREVARDYLRVSPDKVRAWIRKGELAATNTSTGHGRKRWIISLEALAEFQARRKPETPPKPAPRKPRRPQMRDYFP